MMKYRYLMLAALMLCTTLVSAKPFGGGGHDRERMMEQFEALDLSKEQKSAIKDVFQASKESRKALWSEKRTLFKQLHGQTAESLTPAEIDRLSAEFGRLSTEGMRQRLEMKAAFARILTPEQRQQWQAQREAHREEMREQRSGRDHEDI